MNENLTKGLVIATSIFISIGIVTAALIGVNTYKKSYQLLNEDEKMGIADGFGELDKYNNTELNAVETLNAAKKFWRHNFVKIYIKLNGFGEHQLNEGLNDDLYQNEVNNLKTFLEKEDATSGMSYYNKRVRATIVMDDANAKIPATGVIDAPLTIRFEEV